MIEAQTTVSLDDGWGLPDDTTGTLTRIVPDDSNAFPSKDEEAALDAFDLDSGWNLAEGTGEHTTPSFPQPGVVPIEFCPTPLEGARTLGPEQQAEFSKPDLALGTDIDIPPPSGAWFAELTGLAPRTPPKTAPMPTPSAPTELHLKSCFTESEDAFFASGEEIELTHQQQRLEVQSQEETRPVRRRWWRRARHN